MTEDASAGRLYVDVLADASGFEPDLRRKVATASDRVKARIKVEVDQRGMQQQLRAEARRMEASARIKARVEIDPSGLRQSLQRAINDATRQARAKVKVDVEINRDQLQRDLTAAVAEVRANAIKVPVEADTSKVESSVDQTRRNVSRKPINLDVRVRENGLEKVAETLTSLAKAPAIASGIFVLVGAVGNLVAGLTALTSVAGSAVGALGAIPAAGGAAIQFIGTAITGFKGIGDAYKALGEADKASAAGSAATAAQREAAAQRIESAQRGLQDATRAANETAIRGNEAIRSAELRVADAHRNTLQAQMALNDARKEAAERLRDLRLELSGAALDEEGAKLAVERAAYNLKHVREDRYSSTLDRKEADLALRQAKQRLAETKEGNEDLRKSAEAARKAGVKGDAQVVDASNKVKDAKQTEAEAQRALGQTVAQAARDNAQAAVRVARAQQDMAQALKKSRSETSANVTAQDKMKAAMKNLTPEGRKFVRFLYNDLKPRLTELRKTAQRGLLPGVQAGLERLTNRFLPKLDRALAKTSKRLGRVAEDGAKTLDEGPFARNFDDIVDSNTKVIGRVGDGLFHIVNGMSSLVHGSGPFLEKVAKAFGTGAENFEKFMDQEDRNGGIEAFFDRAYVSGSKLWTIVKNVGGAIGDMAKAARPAGNTLLDDLVDATDRLREWTSSPDGQAKMEQFFRRAVRPTEQIGNLILKISELLIQITDATGGGTLDGFFLVLDGLADALTALSNIPGVGKVLNALFLLSGVGLGMGLVAGAVGRMYKNLRNLTRLTGLAKLLDKIRGTSGTTGTGGTGKPGSGTAPGTKPGGKPGGGRTTVVGGDLDGGRRQEVYWRQAMPVKVSNARQVAGQRGGGGGGAYVGSGGGKGETKVEGRLMRLLRRVPFLGPLLGVGGAAGGGKLAGKFGGKLAKGGGIAGLIAGILGSMAGDFIAGDSKTGTARRTIGSGVSGAATGAGIGALAGSVVPGVGTAIGAGVGGAIGGIWGLLSGSGVGGKLWKGLKDGSADAFDQMKDSWNLNWARMKTTVDNFDWSFGLGGGGVRGGGIDWSHLGDGFSDAWDGLKEETKTSWNRNVKQPLSNLAGGVKDIWDDLGEETKKSWHRNVERVKTAAHDIRDGVKGAWESVRRNSSSTWASVREATKESWERQRRNIRNVGGDIKDFLRDTGRDIKDRWTQHWNVLKDNTARIFSDTRERLKQNLNTIKDSFRSARENIAEQWNRLRGAFSSPIRFLVNTVYMKGIRPMWNRVATKFGGTELPEASFEFARGGTVPGYAPGKDRVSALLSPGEGVLVPEAVRGIAKTLRTTGSNAVQALNAAYSNRVKTPTSILPRKPQQQGQQRFAGGGIVDGAGDILSGAYGAAREGIGNIGSVLKDVFLGGLRKAATAAMKPIRALIDAKLDDNDYERLIAGMANKGIDGLLGFLGKKDADAKNPGTGQFPSSAGKRWPARVLGQVASNTAAAAAALKQAFPGTPIGMLGSRPNVSDHPWGKALDAMVGYPGDKNRAKGNAIANWGFSRATDFGLKYLIWYDQITNGSGWQPYTHPNGETDNPTLRHLDHVHMSFLKDGAVVRPRPNGTTVRLGEAGRSEAVVDEGLLNRRLDDLEEIRRLLKDVALRPNITIEAPVTNAVPETAPESLPKVLRKSLHLAGVTEG